MSADATVSPTRKARRVTAAMVAERAGVSVATVSYVVNNNPNQTIPDATKERVRAAVRDLGYTPSAAARALRTGSNDAVLLMIPDWPATLAVAQLVDALTDEFTRIGLRLITEREGASSPEVWRSLSPRAVLAFGDLEEDERTAMTSAGILVLESLVITGRHERESLFSQQAVGVLQAEHLIGRGHHNIGYAAAAQEHLRPFSDLRLAGVVEACVRKEVAAPLQQRIAADGSNAIEALAAWLSASPRATAVAAFNDEVAAALLAAARAQSVAVPGELAIIGVDDQPMSQFTEPPLTSARQNPSKMADHLAQVVRSRLAGEPAPALPHSVVELIPRSST